MGFYILIAIFLFFIMVLFSSLTILVEFKEELNITIRCFFFKYRIYPENRININKKKNIKKKNNLVNKNFFNSVNNTIKNNGLDGFIEILQAFHNLILRLFKKFFSHVVVNTLNVNIIISEEDAATTAVYYGCLCSILIPFVEFIVENNNCKRKKIAIKPKFNSNNKTRIRFKIRIHIKFIYLLLNLKLALMEYIKINKRIKNKI